MKQKQKKVHWKPHAGPQTEALKRTEFEVLYGGARGGGKTDAGMAWLAYDIDNPKFRALVIRRNSNDLSDWIDRARDMYGPLGGQIAGNPPVITFPSGAKIRTGHLKDDDAYTKYQGHEYHRMLIEELTQIPDEENYLKLIGSCRSTIQNLPAQVFATTNPGGKGHGWVKERFIDKSELYSYFYTDEKGTSHQAKMGKPYFDSREGRSRIFIKSTIEDNPTLAKNDPQYLLWLDSLPNDLRRAWREGDWDIFAGQFFKEFRRDIHVREPFTIPSTFRRFMGIDYGSTNPFAAYWIAIDWDGNYWCVSPEMRVLTTDLQWKPARELHKGEFIAGFDEEVPRRGKRRWRDSKILEIETVRQPTYKMTLDSGKEIKCSENHMWLVEEVGRRKKWKRTVDIKETDSFLQVMDVWDIDRSYTSGYLAAAYDGEGSYGYNNKKTPVLSFSQRKNEMLSAVKAWLGQRGIRFGVYQKKVNDVQKLEITRKADQAKLLGTTRPARLLPKFSFDKFGGFNAIAYPKMVSIEYLGFQDVIAMKTSTRTNVVEGLASHNCYREYYKTGLTAEQNARNVVNLQPDEEQVEMAVADNSIFAKQGYGETIADIMRRNGIGQPGTKIPMLEPSTGGRGTRIARAQLLRQKLSWGEDKSPQIYIFSTCTELIRTLPTLVHDEKNPEDVDTSGEDHGYDSVTYALQKIEDVQVKEPPHTRVDRILEDMRRSKEITPEKSVNIRFNKDI